MTANIAPPFPLGVPLDFFGVDNHRFKLGGKVYEAVEDPDDGYRSYLGSIEAREGGIFYRQPLGSVIVEQFKTPHDRWGDSTDEGFLLKSAKDGHVWLRFGTANTEDWYPWFLWEYNPRPPPTE